MSKEEILDVTDVTVIKTIELLSKEEDAIIVLLVNGNVFFKIEEGQEILVDYKESDYLESEIKEMSKNLIASIDALYNKNNK